MSTKFPCFSLLSFIRDGFTSRLLIGLASCAPLCVTLFGAGLRPRRRLTAGLPNPAKTRCVPPWLGRETGHNRHLKLLLVCLASCILSATSGCTSRQDALTAQAAAEDEPRQAETSKDTNRLAEETSPYLLLHAHNPVDWYPWGAEALAKAKRENKLIFLSIGYSSCHWCHVMERESFMDEEIAALMNEHFVCIKVDREERPDIDAIYMTALQVFYQLTGSGRGGGWPLSMFLTPQAKPFFGGTYFPARDGDRGTGVGFLTILKKVNDFWKNNAEIIATDADTIARVTKDELEGVRAVALTPLDKQLITATQEALDDLYDEEYGGFGYDSRNPQRPKFPEPSNLFFLIDRAKAANDARARQMLVGTLERMAMGGIRDHVGGGFHRYSVDRFWTIPHFEKMLYDNGQLTSVYTEAHLLTGREDFKRVVVELLDFVLREMTDERGGFYAALDAESEGVEGKYYRWDKQEIENLLTEDQFALMADLYGLNDPPNFEEHYYALQLQVPLPEAAAKRELSEDQLEQLLVPIREKLLAARTRRARPLTDTKILTSWNGLMIRGLADAGHGLGEERYVRCAEKAAQFVLAELRSGEGRLLRTYGQGQAKLNAYLDDYAFLVDGLIGLFQATGKRRWLQTADELTAKQIELFWDNERGGFYFTAEDHETLLARAKDPVDGAIPSGNSVAAQNLIFLSVTLNKPEYLEKAEATIQATRTILQHAPAAAPRTSLAVAQLLAAKAQQPGTTNHE